MKANVKELSITVNATIELRGIALDAYQDILGYIVRVDANAFDETKSECVIANEETRVETPDAKPKYAGPDKRLDILNKLLADYDRNESRYRLIDLTFEQIVERIPELSGVSVLGFGQRYAAIQRCGLYSFLKVGRIHSTNGTYLNVYTIPIIRKTMGYLIKKAREEARLSKMELCDLMGVPFSALSGWEADVFTPSEISKSLLKKALGHDIFDELDS